MVWGDSRYFLILVVIFLLAALHEGSVTISFHLCVANTCVEIYWALNYHWVTSAATLINYRDVAYSQGMLKTPCRLLLLYDFHRQGSTTPPPPRIKLTKQVLQDVLIRVSRWLPPPWHSGGLPGSAWDVLGCAADAWVYSGRFYCAGSGGGLGASMVQNFQAEDIHQGSSWPAWCKAGGFRGCSQPRQGPPASWDPGHSIARRRSPTLAQLTG